MAIVSVRLLVHGRLSVPLVLSTGGCQRHGLLCVISAHPSSMHPIHPDRSQPFVRSCQILSIKSGPGLVCVHHGLLHPISPRHLIHSPIPPQQVSDSASLASSPYLASHCLIIFSLIQNHFGYGGILGGPNVAIGYLFNWLMANCQSHSWFFWYGGILGGCHEQCLGFPGPT